ncbi:MAG TPA: DUF45 domain-containing protein [Anaerohalosphaeraceae bacterium]|jgi:predicted metal-dependent hydrolase|nr:DUF45 domain-containing protein [Anaerohalosphaeraceae bacterium]HRT49334.1 DUF45 domain-containing protein [Anaerohalosphaeraceae bacterium]HRT85937.1 DUF45 domain-containing protein [Anaerohalosphaeraceae bacterium]
MKRQGSQKISAATKRIVEVPELGEVVLAKSRRARRLSITITLDKGVRVAVPYRTSFADAQAFMTAHIGWARKHVARIARIRQAHESTLNGLPAMNPDKTRLMLKSRLSELSRQYGFSYNQAFIRNQRTRWGSCSHKNNINLNISLARLRPELMDYVILHELLHTRIKNHGRIFWRELDKLVGNARALDAELKNHVLGLAVERPCERQRQ